MRCPQCGTVNHLGAKFCDECAAPLPQVCPSCRTENRPEAKFCQECATPLTTSRLAEKQRPSSHLSTADAKPILYTPKHLAERILAEQLAMEARGAVEGERKTVTALFADIKNSMGLIEDLDPEEARSIIDPALQLMMEAVHHYEGYVAQSLGDGIFALFGAPLASEDHPQRAIYAALRMQEESRRLAEMLRREKGVNLQIRVGINTGEVVMRSIQRDDLHADYTPIGHSTSLAARMESLAAPGSVLISEHTYRLVDGYFECKALGPALVKGTSEPIHLYEVLGAGPLQTRLQVAARRGLSRFIGRQDELLSLQQALEHAKRGQGSIHGVRGAPGVGKSRLFHEFKQTAGPGCLVLETFALPHGKSYAYLPLVELLKGYFHISAHDDERRRREKITGKVLTLDRDLEETLPYLFGLLGVSEPSGLLQQLDRQLRRRRTFEAITRLLVRESANQPLVLICEDLHWIDNETQSYLLSYTSRIADVSIFLLVNYRPEYQSGWIGQPYFTQVPLEPLGQKEAEELLSMLLGVRDGLTLEPTLRQLWRQILDKTQGNPLFMEEIVRALFEEEVLVRDTFGRAVFATPVCATLGLPPPELQIPPTVQAVLAARIDRLPPDAKEFLQMVAVIGKEFPLTLVLRVSDVPEAEVHRLLAQLQSTEFIYQQPAKAGMEYSFTHTLTQEVAYNSLLLERRRALHERTAQAIEAVFPQQMEEHYGELAHHYGQSGNTWKAIDYLQLAGEQAVQRSANAEAIEHLTIALELLKSVPDGPEVARRELTLRLALGVPLIVTRGIGSNEVGTMYERALVLAQQLGETALLFPVLRGLWEFHEVRGALPTARALGERLLTLARRENDPALSLIAHGALADTLLWGGEFSAASQHADQGIASYAPAHHRALAFLYGGHDLGVASVVWKALALWHLGYPEQADFHVRRALFALEELAHSYSTAHTLSFLALLSQLRRQGQAVQERVEAVMLLSQEQEFTQYNAMTTILHGWVLTEHGNTDEGIERMEAGLAAWRAIGAELMRPYYLALLAEAHGKVGHYETGLRLLDEALLSARGSRECWWEAELYRLKGDLLLKSHGAKKPTPEPGTLLSC
ncbi:MAG: AAA family ATPase [Deltaproteobacteria bacterium]|nr:AAA family ATPase [Deltaproteobacteria bacterium]